MASGKKKSRVFRLNNFFGLVNTMAEDNAYTTIDPQANLGTGFVTVPFEFKRVENFIPTRRGGLSKTFGYNLLKDTASASPINGIYRYSKANGTSYFLVAYGTAVYTLSAGTLTSIGMTVANAFLDFETAYDKVIICDGSGQPQTYDGSTVANLTTGSDATAVAGARQAVFHQNRLFIFSSTHDQSLVYYSDGGLIGQGYAANFVQCNVNNGQKVTGISQFFIPGDLQPVLVVTKEKSIGIIAGDGTVTNPYTYIEIAKDIGVPSFRQSVQFEQDYAFFTNQGVCSYNTAVAAENLQRRMLSEKIANQFTGLSQTYLGNALGWLDWKNYRISFAFPTGSSQYANTLWHYDIDLKGWYKQTGFDVTSAFTDDDGTVYTGTSDGKILEHTASAKSYDGDPIVGVLETPYIDFFEPHYYKRFTSGRVVARGDGEYNLGISCSLNNGLGTGSTHTVPLSAGAYTWGMGTWNSTGVYLWGSAPLVRAKIFPAGMFENISFTITQTGADEPVDLLEMILEVEYLQII